MNLTDITYLVVDTETTGMDPERAEVVELAGKTLSTETPTEHEFSKLYAPSGPIPLEAKAVHHIGDADVEDCPRFDPSELTGKVDESTVLVAHNAQYDATVTGTGGLTWLCTWRLASHLLPDSPSHSNQVLRYYIGDELHLPDMTGLMPHRALADVYVTHGILRYLLRKAMERGIRDLEALKQLEQSPIPMKTIKFGKHKGTRWEDLPMDYLQWMVRKGTFDEDTMFNVKRELDRRRGR